MPFQRFSRVLSFMALSIVALLVASPTLGADAAAPLTQKSDNPKSSATAKSVTVFPIILNTGAPVPGVSADMSKNMAELIGLLLERGGMKEIEIADAPFIPSEKADLAEMAEAFGRFVQSKNIRTEYALYGQFFGTPGKGVDEIRLVVVDRQGKVVLSELRDREQLARLNEERVDPMIACYHLFGRLRPFWGLADSNEKDAPEEGKMARLWAEKSGLPPKAELDAMKARLIDLKNNLKTSSMAVYPVHVSGKSDETTARALAQMLAKEGIGRAEASGVDPKLEIKPSTNQTRIAWDSARAFRDFLRKNPPDADYALLAVYGIGRTTDGKTTVGGVHFVLCDRKGEWVLAGLRNSHHADFQRINPQTADDCNRLVVEALRGELQ